jgi:hypothetical protein
MFQNNLIIPLGDARSTEREFQSLVFSEELLFGDYNIRHTIPSNDDNFA